MGLVIIFVSYPILLFFGFMTLFSIIEAEPLGGIIFFGIITLAGLLLFIYGFEISNINLSPIIKHHPEILELVNNLYDNIIFENDKMIVSELAIAPKSRLITTVNRYEVIAVHVSPSLIMLETESRLAFIKYSGPKDELKKYCPNAKMLKLKNTLAYFIPYYIFINK